MRWTLRKQALERWSVGNGWENLCLYCSAHYRPHRFPGDGNGTFLTLLGRAAPALLSFHIRFLILAKTYKLDKILPCFAASSKFRLWPLYHLPWMCDHSTGAGFWLVGVLGFFLVELDFSPICLSFSGLFLGVLCIICPEHCPWCVGFLSTPSYPLCHHRGCKRLQKNVKWIVFLCPFPGAVSVFTYFVYYYSRTGGFPSHRVFARSLLFPCRALGRFQEQKMWAHRVVCSASFCKSCFEASCQDVSVRVLVQKSVVIFQVPVSLEYL